MIPASSAQAVRRTHCIHGHPLDGIKRNGASQQRFCRTCHRTEAMLAMRRKRAAAQLSPRAEVSAHSMTPAIEARFWAKVDKRGPDECWPWLATLTTRGYGQFWFVTRPRRAHIVAWELANGQPFPEGMVGCHRCDNPPCVNPAHIWPGTRSENLLDAARKGRVRNQYGPAFGASERHAKYRMLGQAGRKEP